MVRFLEYLINIVFWLFLLSKTISNFIDKFASQTILTCKNGKTTAFIRANDKMIFAKKLEEKIKSLSISFVKI